MGLPAAANQPQVRIKLSAEGLKEVKDAFAEVSKQAKKSAGESQNAFKGFDLNVQKLAVKLAAGLGIGLTINEFRKFFMETVKTGVVLEKFAGQTGLSTDAMQSLQLAARETDTDAALLTAGMVKLGETISDAAQGSAAAGKELAGIGVDIKSIQTLPIDQKFKKVIDALVAIPDPSRRAGAEIALLGKKGFELNQVLVSVANGGFDTYLKKLKESNRYLDTDTIAATKRAEQSLQEMEEKVKGLGTQFMLSLMPSAVASLEAIEKGSKSATGGITDLGKAVGFVGRILGALVSVIVLQFTLIGAFLSNLVDTFAGTFKTLKVLVTEGSQAAGREWDNLNARIEDRTSKGFDDIKAKLAAARDLLLYREKAAEAPPSPEKPKPVEDPQAEINRLQALANANRAFVKARLDSELKLYQAHASLQEATLKNSYNQQLLKTKEYYAERHRLTIEGFEKEEKIATQRLRQAQTRVVPLNDPVAASDKQSDVLDARAAIQLIQIKREQALVGLMEEEREVAKRDWSDRIAAQVKINQIKGQTVEAAKIEAREAARLLDLELRKADVASEPERESAVTLFENRAVARAEFDELVRNAERSMDKLKIDLAEIEAQASSGQILKIESESKGLGLQAQRLPALKAQSVAMSEMAAKTGDALDVDRAAEFANAVKRIEEATDLATQQMGQLKNAAVGALESGLSGFLTDIATNAKSVKGAFQDMARSIISAMAQVAAQMLIQRAIMAFAGPSVPGVKMAGGGYVLGPGSRTSDSIPAWLSNGEFVVRAAVVARPGVLDFLSKLNAGAINVGVSGGRIPRFASGGFVSQQAAAVPVFNFRFVNVTDPSMQGEHLESREGERSVLNIISRNPGKIRSFLR